MSLMNSSVPSTRQEWYVRVNLHIRYQHFASKSRTESGVLCMLITILMRLLFRHRHTFLERMSLNNMVGCTMYSALDLVYGYYQLLMRASDISLTAVSTSSGMLWEWLVMTQGLPNAPAIFNILVTQLSVPIGIMHRHALMTFLSIAVPSKVGRMLTTIYVICEPAQVYAHE